MKRVKQVLFGSVLALTVGSVGAATVSSFLQAGPNQASDENREYLINRGGGATTVDVGDSLRGFVNMNTLNAVGANLGGATPNNEWTAIFQALVTSKVAVGGGLFTYTFGPDPAFVADICGGVGAPCVSGFVPGTGALVVMFEDAVHNFALDGAGTREGLGATATDGSFFWTLGFSGVGGAADGTKGEGWAAVTLSNLGDDIANAALFSSGTSGAIINAGLSCLTSGVGDCSRISQVTAGAFGPVQIALSGDVRGISDLTTPFQASSNTNVSFNRIPEPGTLALLGIALAGLGFSSRRGTKKPLTA
jgi:hypothetical protein